MSARDAQHAFYRERVVEQFNRTLAEQRAAAGAGPAAAALLEEMEAVRTAIVVQVDLGGDEIARHAYEIERGEMRAVDQPTRAPFLRLGHHLEDFEPIRRECGNSLLGFLGSLAGLGEEMRLTSRRVRSLRELDGSLVLERVGPEGFRLFAHFGVEAPAATPRTTIRLDAALHAALRAGEVDPQAAFLDGRVEIEGDEGMAIGLALAALSPD